MIASAKLIDAMNQQVGHELHASHQYVAMAAYFAAQALTELARFFYRQAGEEREHAMKFVHFIVDAGGSLAIPEIPAAKARFKTAEEAIEAAVEWEMKVTRQIYDLVELAREEGSYIALRFLDWFVSEQFEEVTTMSGLLQVVKRAGEKRLIEVENFLAREGDEIEGPPPQG